MATPKDIRKLALMALFQFDATAGDDLEGVRASLEDTESFAEEGLSFTTGKDFTPAELDRAVALAHAAYEAREGADAAMLELAPDWPAGRQAAVDRAILRLAHHEITATDHPPKAVVNEAVELAKDFSTEKSPAFVNGLLGKFLKAHLSGQTDTPAPAEAAPEPASDTAPDSAPESAPEPTTEPTSAAE